MVTGGLVVSGSILGSTILTVSLLGALERVSFAFLRSLLRVSWLGWELCTL